MSVSCPLRYLFANSPKLLPCVRHNFHTCSPLHGRQPKHPSIKAEDLGLLTNQAPVQQPTRKRHHPKASQHRDNLHDLKPYSKDEWKALAQIYTPEQLQAIEAGEAAIDRDDLMRQGALREDSFALPYFEDLSQVHPVVDKPIRAPESNYDPNLRYKEEDELLDDIVEWGKNLPEDPEQLERLDWIKFRDNVRLTVGKEEAERNPRSYIAPELPTIKGLRRRSSEDDIDPTVRRLMLQTGYSTETIYSFRVKLLVMHRVVNQTRMGKVQSLYYLAIAGNGKGLLGIGEGKSTEAEDGRKQASWAAIRNMVPIPRYENRTIFGDVKGKVGATEVEVMSRPPGRSKSISLSSDYYSSKEE